MNRPPSIITFERCYLGALVVSLVNTLLSWHLVVQQVTVQRSIAMIGPWFLPVTSAIGYLIPLLLWFFAARRASVVAKWIITVFFALGAFGVLISVAFGSFPWPIGAVLSITALVLNAIAVSMLFRPDAKLWFGEMTDDDMDALA